MWIMDIGFFTIIFLVILAMIIEIFWEKTAAIILVLWFFFLILSPIQFLVLIVVASLWGYMIAKD